MIERRHCVIGHRGAAAVAPENTLAGLRACFESGAAMVEFDVMLSRDGRAILHHDETLDRTTTGSGLVAETDWADIRELDAGRGWGKAFHGESPPLFGDAVDLLAELGLAANVEIKPTEGRDEETAGVVLDLIGTHWPGTLPSPLISSFSETCLTVVRDMAPNYRRALLVDRLHDGWKNAMIELGCQDLHASRRNGDTDIAAAIQTGVPVRLHTVNEPARADMLFDLGVAAVFTDDPARIIQGPREKSNSIGAFPLSRERQETG